MLAICCAKVFVISFISIAKSSVTSVTFSSIARLVGESNIEGDS